MDVVSIILNAAKVVKVSGSLLLAICSHESGDFKFNRPIFDNGSLSYGVCQIKYGTALQLGFNGPAKKLNEPRTNAYYAALYLKYQQKRYGNNWIKLAAAYNSGTYMESSIVPGCPRNLKYISLVRNKLPIQLKNKLKCTSEVAEK